MPFRSAWRDCQAWKDEGFPWSTTSNEAVKLYDAALTQVIYYREDPVLGGLSKTLEMMNEADPNFVMGHVLGSALNLSGGEIRNPALHPETKSSIDNALKMAAKQNLTDHENKHVAGLGKLAEGRFREACHVYEDILLEHPEDLAALRIVFFTYFFMGEQAAARDSVASVLPRCRQTMPLRSYMYGLLGFANIETNKYEVGEKMARQALEMNHHDTWATHSIAHALDHTNRADEGISFLTSTVADWQESSHLVCHNTWHLALFHIEKGDHEAALALYDQKIEAYGFLMFNIVDRAALLRRLELKGVDVGGRWVDVYQKGKNYLDDHSYVFQEYHALLTCLGSKHITEAKNFLAETQDVIKKLPSHSNYRQVTESVGIPLYQALIAYEEEDFAAAVNLLQSIKYKTVSIGGSNAQRDLLDQILIDAALKSPDPQHVKLPRALLCERVAMRGTCPTTEDLMSRAMAKHDHI